MVLEVAGVRLTAEIGLATVLGNSEDGMSIPDIAEKTGVDGNKLGSFYRVIRSANILCPLNLIFRTCSASSYHSRVVPRGEAGLLCE